MAETKCEELEAEMTRLASQVRSLEISNDTAANENENGAEQALVLMIKNNLLVILEK
eukprot:m.32870 g.32870  ORF g.32870 m.32870 type:complete len:57 (-) comp14165_c0_seq7:1660-1830(-)